MNGTRFFGARDVALLTIHMNAPAGPLPYKLAVTKKTSTPVQSLKDLVQYILSPAGREEVAPPEVRVEWAGQRFEIKYPTSDIAIEASTAATTGNPPAAQSVARQTFHNEGRTWWDVSVGVPVQGVDELQFNATDGVVRTETVTRENAFAFFEVYPWAVDPQSTGFQIVPLLAGFSLGESPFRSLIFGTGLGIKALRVFAGAGVSRIQQPTTLTPGDSATPAELAADTKEEKVDVNFVWGLNLSVTEALRLLKGK
jgi:hypothetical protein